MSNLSKLSQLSQLETLLAFSIKCRDLGLGEHCMARYSKSHTTACQHGTVCLHARETLFHLASNDCKGNFSGSCSLDCASKKLFLQCFRSHPTEATRLSCKKCSETTPQSVQALSDTIEKLKRTEIEPIVREELKGKIIDCVSKGYTLHEKVIRFSKVVVGE